MVNDMWRTSSKVTTILGQVLEASYPKHTFSSPVHLLRQFKTPDMTELTMIGPQVRKPGFVPVVTPNNEQMAI